MTNLLSAEYAGQVTKTNLTRKLTLDGATKVFTVYRIPIELLFYNDQNDRIATWISEYISKNGTDELTISDKDHYNEIIERFVIDSNPAAIEKTTTNIRLVGQREPGVVLADGRIIDGNRRFTCIREIARTEPNNHFFEAVILESDINADKKQIKMLELSIQHGEEKKVDYNLIDRIIGTYQDIVETGLLTEGEYAASTNESVNEVRKRVAIGQMIVDFLEYIKMPKQYHVARDMQVVSIFLELLVLMRKCADREEAEELKETVFNNLMMGTIVNARKYLRSIAAMMDNGFFNVYLREQERIRDEIMEDMPDEIASKKELDVFVKEHSDQAEDLQISMDKSLLKAKKKATKSRPAQIVTKSISMMKDVDTRIIEKLDDEEKDKLRGQLSKLVTVVDRVGTAANDGEQLIIREEPKTEDTLAKRQIKLALRHTEEPMPVCYTAKEITNLAFSIEAGVVRYLDEQPEEAAYEVCFIDKDHQVASNTLDVTLSTQEKTKCSFILNDRISQEQTVYLMMRSKKDDKDEAQCLIPYTVNIAFGGDFEF